MAGNAVEDIAESLFADLGDGLDWPTVYLDIGQYWSGGWVVIPEPVVNELIVPDSSAGGSLQTDQRIAEEVGTRTFTSVVVVRGTADGQIDIT